MNKKPYKHMPIIVFDHYMLRTIKVKDYKDLFDYGKDSETTRFLNWGPMVIESEAKRSIKEIFYPRIKQMLPKGYAIIDLVENKMIGTIDFHSRIKDQKEAEIGFVLHKDYWNKGIMTKAVCQLIKQGFEYLGYDKIIIKHLSKNTASQKVIEKSGFKWVKTTPYIINKRNKVVKDDLLIYEMTKEDYNGNQ